MLIAATREEAVETIETAGTGKDGEDDKGGKYPKNLAQVPYI